MIIGGIYVMVSCANLVLEFTSYTVEIGSKLSFMVDNTYESYCGSLTVSPNYDFASIIGN